MPFFGAQTPDASALGAGKRWRGNEDENVRYGNWFILVCVWFLWLTKTMPEQNTDTQKSSRREGGGHVPAPGAVFVCPLAKSKQASAIVGD